MIRKAAIAVIRAYQCILSPFLGPCCRFTPSCSEYAAICISRFGVIRGSWLGLRRLISCHPFGRFGYDPPPADENAQSSSS